MSQDKAAIIVTGGGISFIRDLLTTPGNSSKVESVYIPYGTKQTIKLLEYTPPHFVTEKVSVALARAALRCPEATCSIACTASLVTNRIRRGKDHAWISTIGKNGTNSFYVELDKSNNPNSRQFQDEMVSKYLKIMFDKLFA